MHHIMCAVLIRVTTLLSGKDRYMHVRYWDKTANAVSHDNETMCS